MLKRGGQPGNQNARKHGFYSKILTEQEKLALEEAGNVEGLDDEIALLRLKLRSLLRDCPDRVDLQVKVIDRIAGLVRTRYGLTPKDTKTFRHFLISLLKDIGISLGMKFIH